MQNEPQIKYPFFERIVFCLFFFFSFSCSVFVATFQPIGQCSRACSVSRACVAAHVVRRVFVVADAISSHRVGAVARLRFRVRRCRCSCAARVAPVPSVEWRWSRVDADCRPPLSTHSHTRWTARCRYERSTDDTPHAHVHQAKADRRRRCAAC